jgi:WD40 repeat protein
MLGKKRFNTKSKSKGNEKGKGKGKGKGFKSQKTKVSFKAKSYTNKKKNDDEEIISDSEEEINNSLSQDGFFEKEKINSSDEENENLKESADTKRLKMARKLITEIEGKMINENDEYENEEKENKRDLDLDGYLKEQMQRENNEYQQELYKKINPKHKIFLKGHLSSITEIDISSDSKQLISVGKDCRAIKWDLETNKKFLLPQFTKRSLLTCIWAPDDKNVFFAGADRHIYQMDVHNEKLIQSFKAHNDTISGLLFDPNQEQYYSIGYDKVMNVWGVSPTQKSIKIETFYGHTNKINDLDFLLSGKILTCGSDHQMNLWKLDSQSFLKFQSNDSFISLIDNLRVLNSSTFATGGNDGTVSIWKTNKKKAQNKILYSHGYSKEFKPEHDFFSSENNLLNYNNDIIKMNINKGNNKGDIDNNINDNNINEIKIPNPICSLATIRNSDIIFSGSLNGKMNVYRCFNGNNISLLKNIEVEKGCINTIKVNKTNEFMILGYGKDQRLGRWFTDKTAKCGISIVKLFNE